MMSDWLIHLLFYAIGVIIGCYINDKFWHEAVTEAIEEVFGEWLDGKE